MQWRSRLLAQCSDGLDPVHALHADVHDDHIGFALGDQVQCLSAARLPTTSRPSWDFEELANTRRIMGWSSTSKTLLIGSPLRGQVVAAAVCRISHRGSESQFHLGTTFPGIAELRQPPSTAARSPIMVLP